MVSGPSRERYRFLREKTLALVRRYNEILSQLTPLDAKMEVQALFRISVVLQTSKVRRLPLIAVVCSDDLPCMKRKPCAPPSK